MYSFEALIYEEKDLCLQSLHRYYIYSRHLSCQGVQQSPLSFHKCDVTRVSERMSVFEYNQELLGLG